MGLFSKPEITEIEATFKYLADLDDSDNLESGCFDIESVGHINGEKKYFFASFNLKNSKLYDGGDYEEMLQELSDVSDKVIKLIIETKGDKIKSFEIDLKSLATAMGDDRFLELDMLGYGIHDKSVLDR